MKYLNSPDRKSTKRGKEIFILKVIASRKQTERDRGGSEKDLIKEKIDKLHKFESKERQTKSPKKPLLKSKEEGQILGLPPTPPDQEKDNSKDEDFEEEASIYFFEDDEEELENL